MQAHYLKNIVRRQIQIQEVQYGAQNQLHFNCISANLDTVTVVYYVNICNVDLYYVRL